MDKDSAGRLWEKAYEMHGSLGMHDVCRLMVFALFIRYIDIENAREDSGMALASYDVKYSAGYLALTYGKMAGPEDVAGYVEEAEKELLRGDGIIAAEFGRLLEKADAGWVQAVFDSIDKAGYESRSQIYEAASLLLDRLSYAHGNLTSGTSANLSLCRLEGRILDCQAGMTVYDGFCGYGLSASEAAGGRGIVYMQDMDRGAAAIAAVMALLKGNRAGSVRCGDSLLSPISPDKYDRIVCEPPIGRKYEKSYCSAIPEGNLLYPEISDTRSLGLRHALAHLADNGMAVVMVPMGMLVNQSSSIRKKLADGYLDAVVELPSGALPNIRAATALLVLRKGRQNNTIYMINTKDYFKETEKNRYVISDADIDRIVKAYKNREAVEGISCNVERSGIKSLSVSQCLLPDMDDAIPPCDTALYQEKYGQLAGELAGLDRQLEGIRGRFIKAE